MGGLTLKETIPTPDSAFLGHVLGFDKGKTRPPSVWAGRDPGCELGSGIFRGLGIQTEQWALGNMGQKGYLQRASRLCFDF